MSSDTPIHSDVHNDVSKPVRPRRLEVLTGVERRRRWLSETKLAIVLEALEPGAVVSEVARRHDINPPQLFGWIKRLRADAAAMIAAKSEAETRMFAPLLVDASAASGNSGSAAPTAVRSPMAPASLSPVSGRIEIVIGAATVRVVGEVDESALTTVLKTLKALA